MALRHQIVNFKVAKVNKPKVILYYHHKKKRNPLPVNNAWHTPTSTSGTC